ncbi:Alpha/beta hydrolase fold-3 [Macleaya cordata]|uniref:Alpha/beta hydrolase fold-3 n=1 Tax=Macleaya cordata TaxID=56857 RepID=A0A200RDW7_MACCD|nr:Alpha/beta hydrolase fold-3 [Macleaya cordata]
MKKNKKVVDQVSCWLKIFDDGSVDRTWMGPPEFEFMAKPVPPHEDFIDGVATRDVTMDNISGLSARIYLPERKSGDGSKLPVLLHFHGGGFCISQADWYMYYQAYTQLVRSAQAVCVSVKLRLAPEHRLPAACDDGYSTLLWLRSVARAEAIEPWLEAHADFSRVFLIGDSSGGNIVHEVAARAGKEKWDPLSLAGGVLLHPGFVRAERSKSELETQNESPFLTLEMVDKFLALALPLGSTKDHPITCPMGSMAPPLDGLNLPPFLMAVAELDLIRDTELEYIEAMKKAGKDVEVFHSEGVGHSFYLKKVPVEMDPQNAAQTDLLIAGITDFIKRH